MYRHCSLPSRQVHVNYVDIYIYKSPMQFTHCYSTCTVHEHVVYWIVHLTSCPRTVYARHMNSLSVLFMILKFFTVIFQQLYQCSMMTLSPAISLQRNAPSTLSPLIPSSCHFDKMDSWDPKDNLMRELLSLRHGGNDGLVVKDDDIARM